MDSDAGYPDVNPISSEFGSLGLYPEIVAALSAQSITIPTPVQRSVIPRLLSRENIVMAASTGSGKTLAYALPAVQVGGSFITVHNEIISHCTITQCLTILHYTILYYTILYYTILGYTILYYTMYTAVSHGAGSSVGAAATAESIPIFQWRQREST